MINPAVTLPQHKPRPALRLVKTGGTFLAVAFGGATYLTDSEAFDPTGRERFVEVISGLTDGEKLACDAGATLRDGDTLAGAPQ